MVGPVAAFSMTCKKELPLSGALVGITGTDGMWNKLSEKLVSQGASGGPGRNLRIVPLNKRTVRAPGPAGSGLLIVFYQHQRRPDLFEAMREGRMDLREFPGPCEICRGGQRHPERP